MKRLLFWLGLIIILAHLSCKTTKDSIGGKATEKEMKNSWDLLQSQLFPYHSVSYRSKIDIDAPTLKIQVKLNTYLIKDSLLWASVSKFGIESHRMLLTPDTIKILDRLSNQYLVGSTNKWLREQGIDLTFNDLQRLWIGMHPRNPSVSVQPFFIPPNYQIYWQEQGLDIKYLFTLPENRLQNIQIQDQDNQNLQIKQSNFNKHGDLAIPYQRSYSIASSEAMQLEHEIQEVRINESKNLTFHVPERYNQVTL